MSKRIKLLVFITIGIIVSLLISYSVKITTSKASSVPFKRDVVVERSSAGSPVQEKQVKQASRRSSVQVERTTSLRIPIFKASINLNSPDTILVLVSEAEVRKQGFETFVKNSGAALVASGTFPSCRENEQCPGRLENFTMVSENKIIRGAVSQNWSNLTVLGLGRNNQPTMRPRTPQFGGPVPWTSYWFALTSNPGLVKRSQVCGVRGCDRPQGSDQKNLDRPVQRAAIGFNSRTKTLYHVITDESRGAISIKKLGEVMKNIGCDEAVNLEGGDAVLLGYNGKVLVEDKVRAPVIVVYDAAHPAPSRVRQAWNKFQVS